jgi:hypothetical protein
VPKSNISWEADGVVTRYKEVGLWSDKKLPPHFGDRIDKRRIIYVLKRDQLELRFRVGCVRDFQGGFPELR